MIEYTKIETPFARDMNGGKKLLEGVYRNSLVEYLKDCKWSCTEKIDGTNIGVVWDGHKVSFQGRTERAQIPAPLVNRLNELFGGEVNEELFEQLFGEEEVILFGEGYGAKIQKCGGLYKPDGVDFIMFDIYLPKKDLWLKRESLEDIARAFGIQVVPEIMISTLDEAIAYVKSKPMSTIGTAPMEGLVCKPLIEIRDRMGERVVVKVKVKDF
jgi:hypothetical protein